MKREIVRILVALSLFALAMGAGFTGSAVAQEGAASDCGDAHGFHNAIGFGPGADFGHAAAEHGQDVENQGPPGETVSTVCDPAGE